MPGGSASITSVSVGTHVVNRSGPIFCQSERIYSFLRLSLGLAVFCVIFEAT